VGRAACALTLLALALSSCMSLKENTVVQTTPGKVTIRTVVCASNYANVESECAAKNVFATHNNQADANQDKTGQLLVGFRVPIGVTAPTSFSTKDPAVSFTRSATYARELKRLFEPPPDQQWIGYISAVGDYKPTGPRLLAMEPEFTLPEGAAGTAFRWRSVVGFREGADAAAPVSCPQPPGSTANPCIESPAEARIPSDEVTTAISDFGVVGATTTAFPGTTAVVPFKLRYSDAARLGRQPFSFRASTALPRTNARAPGQILANPNDSTEVQVQVPVPTGTAAGRHEVTLRGGIGSPPAVREATGTIIVAALPQQGDKPPPLPAVGRVKFAWLPTRSRGLRFTRLVATDVPSGATVTVRCRGGGCPPRSKPIKRRRSTVSLSRQFRGRTLRRRAVVTIRIAARNRIAKEFTLTIRGPVEPDPKVRCRPPGGTKALRCGDE
jgi:hypothetical protein